MNKKGFMMAELIIVSAVIIGTMATFFISYSKIITKYSKIINYYDVGTIYRLGHYYKQTPNLVDIESKTPDQTIDEFLYEDKLISESCGDIKNKKDESDPEMQDYINYFNNLPDNVKTANNNVEGTEYSESNYCLLLKSCQSKNNKKTCKYAYLVVPD